MFVYKHAETTEYVKNTFYFLRKIQILWVNNSRILMIKNAKFSEYYFYMNLNILGDFQFCISVPLIPLQLWKANLICVDKIVGGYQLLYQVVLQI